MVFVWFWHQGNISLIKWVKNYFLSIVCKKLCIIHANSSSVFDRILQWHWVWGFFFFIKNSISSWTSWLQLSLAPALRRDGEERPRSSQWGLGTDSRCFQSTVPLPRSRVLHLRAGQRRGAGSCAVWILHTDLSVSAPSSLLHP